MTAAPDLAGWWRQYEGAYEGRSWRDYRHLLAETVRYGSGPPLLDVGSGFGFLVECARQFGMPAVGLEASEHALSECRRRHPHVDVRRWQAGTPLPFEDGAIGMAMLNQIVDHFSLVENRSLFGELHRVLNQEGILVVHSPSRFNRVEQSHDSGHVTFFTPSEFRTFVAGFGFHVIAQPYQPQRMFDSDVGWLLVRAVARVFRPERLAATIDLVAAKAARAGAP
jgi:SAM-dependent methyltransferase